jgi:hypothetical protein
MTIEIDFFYSALKSAGACAKIDDKRNTDYLILINPLGFATDCISWKREELSVEERTVLALNETLLHELTHWGDFEKKCSKKWDEYILGLLD